MKLYGYQKPELVQDAVKLDSNENYVIPKQFQNDIISTARKNSDSSGIRSVEKYLESQIDISEIKNQLSYLGTHHQNILYKIFDQLFYGPVLYQKLFRNNSQFSEDGLIEQDVVIVNNLLLESLQKNLIQKL